MAQLADYISRIFSSARPHGLSGGAELVVDPDPAAAFHVARLRRHRADGDYITAPALLWSCVSYGQRTGGLKAHMAAERGEGLAGFTDVLVVVSSVDAGRATPVVGEPWTDFATRELGQAFTAFCIAERFSLLYGTRPLRFRLIVDGGKDMLGQSFGLEAGEFITGLLPNLYVGPSTRSRPALTVHLNLPGVWQGYRDVGRLYNDQIVFTLGRHWLDNYAHPALVEPGIYRLQQYPDGSLIHVISPELQDRYLVRSDQTDSGPNVLTIAELSGRPIAFLVLEVVEPSNTGSLPLAKPRAGANKVALVAPTPAKPGSSAPPSAEISAAMKQKTIIPDAVAGRCLTLHERGALLQKVHFSNFMEGYDVYLGAKAQVVTSTASGPARATIQVRAGRTTLVAQDSGVTVNQKVLNPGQPIVLKGSLTIEVDGAQLEYRDLSSVKMEGWPYVAELRRPGGGIYLEFGEVFQVGRDRRSRVRLPDEPHNDNIAWLPSVGASNIRSRTGDIPKSKFYTDSIMVASSHAEIDLTEEPVLRSLARHCYTYVRRQGEIVVLFPQEGTGGRHEAPLEPNDEVLVGNCLFQVSFPPPGVATAPAAPAAAVPRFNADNLAASVDAIKPQLRAFLTVDPIGPAALGDRGPAPRPVHIALVSAPSLASEGASASQDAELESVVWVEESQWQQDLSRPARLVQVGWSVHGEVTLGNHRDADVVIPEVKSFADHVFLTLDYALVRARGTKGRIQLLQEGEASLDVLGTKVNSTESIDGARIAIVRRDAQLEPDFEVTLSFAEGADLPDPRARLLAVDFGDRLVAGLFTSGLPLRSPRALRLGPIRVMARYDGESVHLSDYLQSYRAGGGAGVPFFVRAGAGPWRTFPEDGEPVLLRSGDHLLAGANLYRLDVA